MATDALLLFYYITALGFTGQLCMLYLQVRAYQRNHHASFALLSASTVVGLLYVLVMCLPLVAKLEAGAYRLVLIAAAVLVSLQFLVGIRATALLFNSYGTLAQRAGT